MSAQTTAGFRTKTLRGGRGVRLGPHAAMLVACLAALLPSDAWPQSFPQRPLRMLIGFPAGGTSDIVGCALADQLASGLGQTVVVDNRSGAAGNLAAELAARAPADGHTLLLSSGSTRSYKKA